MLAAMLLRHPEALPGEAVASWLYRLAYANGFASVRPLIGGEDDPRSTVHDFDLRLKSSNLHQLHKMIGESGDTMPPGGIQQYRMVLTSDFKTSGAQRWLLRDGKNRGPRYAICPACLEAGPAYYRSSWRLAFMTFCQKHQQPMVDRCPHCNETYHLGRARRFPLGVCDACGKKPRSSLAPFKDALRIDSHDAAGLERFAKSCGISAAYSFQIFDGLYAIVCLLNRPGVARRIAQGGFSDMFSIADEIDRDGQVAFESRSMTARHRLFNAAVKMLESWPERFVRTMKAGHVLSHEFVSTDVAVPFWLDAVVHDRLHAPKHRTSELEIEAAMTTLEKRDQVVTKRAVTELLGIRESKALDHHFGPGTFGRVEGRAFLIELARTVASAPTAREEQAGWIRDAAILTLAWASRLRVSEICRMTLSEVAVAAQRVRRSKSDHPQALQAALAFLARYETEVRPRYVAGSCATGAYFVTRFGLRYEGHAVGSRCVQVLRRCNHSRPLLGLSALWDR